MAQRSDHKSRSKTNQKPKPQHNVKSGTAPIRRRCLYDILEVPRSADSKELKAAYKKQAKRWHPDRNLTNTEEATVRFKEINEAFETLSDEQERAWYDAHRDAILRGIDHRDITAMNEGGGAGYDPDIDLMPYFSPFAFGSFDDDADGGFYTVYRSVFDRIVEVEKLSVRKTPSFGDSQTDGSAVADFYRFWECFVSRRSFGWMTRYRLRCCHAL